MIAYASRTGTRRNLDALRAAGWRLMLSPTGVLRTEGFRYALDNGAWTAFAQKTAWDEDKFIDALTRFGAAADFVIAPDIVCGGAASLALSKTWIDACLTECPRVEVAVQNGMTADEISPLLSAEVGVFIGGDDTWKEASMEVWCPLARSRGSWCHVGRVNTLRRLRLCQMAGADSFDGSGPSRFELCLQRMERGLAQPSFRLADAVTP